MDVRSDSRRGKIDSPDQSPTYSQSDPSSVDTDARPIPSPSPSHPYIETDRRRGEASVEDIDMEEAYPATHT